MPYKPWQPLSDCEAFQLVLSMPNVLTGEQMYLPARWANGQDQAWLLRQMEVYAMQTSTPEQLATYSLGKATLELTEYIQRLAASVHFKHEPWDEKKCKQQIELKYDLSLYEKRRTTFGGKLDLVRDAEAIQLPFCDWASLASMMGKIVAKSRNGGGALAVAKAMR